MGQRLNIEIMSGDKVLANAYYHWSAYSESAIEMTRDIINKFYDIQEENDVFKAIKLLESTGAGFNQEERDLIKGDTTFVNLVCKDSIGRNEGLISVSNKGIKETRYWEEGRVTIHIDTETFDFNVLYDISTEDYESEYEKKLDDVPCVENFSFENIAFSNIDKVVEMISKYKESGMRYPNSDFVIIFIW